MIESMTLGRFFPRGSLTVFLGGFLMLGLAVSAWALENVEFQSEFRTDLVKPVDMVLTASGDMYVLDAGAAQVLVFDSRGNRKLAFGVNGAADGQFTAPRAMAVSPEGRIIVADSGNNRVQVFNPAGEFLFSFGASGTAVGQFQFPGDVVVDRFGLMSVADRDNKRVQVFSPNGIYLNHFMTEGCPVDLGMDREGGIYALIPEPGKIVKYSPSGEKLKEFTCRLNNKDFLPRAERLSVDAWGGIYITETAEQSVKKIEQSHQDVALSFGSEGAGRGQFDRIGGMALSARGELFVADTNNGRIQIFQVTGDEELPPEAESFSPLVLDFDFTVAAEDSISDIAVLPGRGVFAISDKKGRILARGKTENAFGSEGSAPGQFLKPAALQVSLDGRIFAADTGNNRIQVLNSDGTPAFEFGKGGSRPGQFSGPQGIAVNSKGLIYVADTMNGRVQVFNHEGIYLNSFATTKENPLQGITGSPSPRALAMDSQDRVYVLEDGGVVRVFDERGKFLKSIGEWGTGDGQFQKAVDLAVDENDNVYVADQANSRIHIFDANGRFVLAFGSPGKGGGYFQEITAVAAAERRIYVADYSSDHIQVFRYDSEGPAAKMERIYSTRTAAPPGLSAGNDVVRYGFAKRAATREAIQEFTDSLGFSSEYVMPFVRIESVESLNDGKVKVTVSIPRNIPVEIKAPVFNRPQTPGGK